MAKNPKYIEIANYFIQKIENEELKENEPLDPEEQLCAKFNVSHMTMAKAMNELSAEGYIKRIPGKGTFISGNYRTSFKKPISSRNSITAQIQEAGMESRIELYKYSIIRGKDDPEVAAKLHISDDEFLHFFITAKLLEFPAYFLHGLHPVFLKMSIYILFYRGSVLPSASVHV